MFLEYAFVLRRFWGASIEKVSPLKSPLTSVSQKSADGIHHVMRSFLAEIMLRYADFWAEFSHRMTASALHNKRFGHHVMCCGPAVRAVRC